MKVVFVFVLTDKFFFRTTVWVLDSQLSVSKLLVRMFIFLIILYKGAKNHNLMQRVKLNISNQNIVEKKHVGSSL